MSRPKKPEGEKVTKVNFSTPIPLWDWFIKNHPKNKRSAALTQMLLSYKEQTENKKPA